MNSYLIVGITLFVVSNFDTLVVLLAFNLDDDYKLVEILIGHAIGFATGLLASVLLSVLATALLHQWTFLIGGLPLMLGIWGLVRRRPTTDNGTIEILPNATGRITVVTIAAIGINGENIAVNVPFFAVLTSQQLLLIVILYGIGAALVFVLAVVIAQRTTTRTYPDWFDDWLVPIVLIAIGGYVLVGGYLAIP